MIPCIICTGYLCELLLQVIPVLRQVALTLGGSVRENVGVNGAISQGALLASCV
jgi:hypothetical protein